jgi:ribosomal small subunit protein bTHX
MGKGDKKSKKGKIHIGTWGRRRPSRKQNVRVVNAAAMQK